MTISLRNLRYSYGGHEVLRGLSLEIAPGELFFLLGPSGCGKTTLLRLMAGFQPPAAGELHFGDRPMNGVPPHRRNVGMVFQHYALWPHLSVADNVGYGLDVRGVAGAERVRRVGEALDLVRMADCAGRFPGQLSGGQQQRVALARALVIRPDVLLLDEPLSNLDTRLRLELREEIRRIHAATRITTVYVTHDQKEALSLADRLAVLRDGTVEQVGDPRSVYRRPASRFAADFLAETNWLEGEVVGTEGTGLRIATGLGIFLVAAAGGRAGDRVWVGFRPESVRLEPGPDNRFTGTVRSVGFLGDAEEWVLATPSGHAVKLLVRTPAQTTGPGFAVTVSVPPEELFVLARA